MMTTGYLQSFSPPKLSQLTDKLTFISLNFWVQFPQIQSNSYQQPMDRTTPTLFPFAVTSSQFQIIFNFIFLCSIWLTDLEFPSRSEKTIQQSFTKAFEVIGTIKITSTASTAQFTMRPYEVHDTLCPTSVAYGPISILRLWQVWILWKVQKYMA